MANQIRDALRRVSASPDTEHHEVDEALDPRRLQGAALALGAALAEGLQVVVLAPTTPAQVSASPCDFAVAMPVPAVVRSVPVSVAAAAVTVSVEGVAMG